MRAAGIEDIVTVTGFRRHDVVSSAEKLDIKTVYNPRFDEGMFSSVQAGAAALPGWSRAFFLLPADIPLFRVSTLHELMRHASMEGVVHPLFRGRHGHPPLIGTALLPAILNFGGEGGLRAFLETRKSWAKEVPVADEGILLDMDTPEDFDRLCRRSRCLHVPSRHERAALLDMAGTPPRVRLHCETVASVCLRLGIALKEKGIHVDLPLLRGSALLHDICKHTPDHIKNGEQFLRRHGFPLLAEITAFHRDLPSNPANEAAILYLADKLVSDRTVVSLGERKKRMKERYGSDKNAWNAVRRRYASARRIARRIEHFTGVPLEILLQKNEPPL